jgi:hypothetical protein
MKKYLVVLALILPACTFVKPADRIVIADHAANAEAVNKKVQQFNYIEVSPDGTQKPADYIKVWWAAEHKTWQALKAWSKGETPK